MSDFGDRLRMYRKNAVDPIKGGNLTLARLTELLEQTYEQHVYSPQAFSLWEKGQRKFPSEDRSLVIAIIHVLYKHNGITSLDEANKLLHAGNYRALDLAECKQIGLPESPARPVASLSPSTGSPLSENAAIYRLLQEPNLTRYIEHFHSLIQRNTKAFVGRDWLFDEIDQFLNANDGGYFILQGQPGIGKTAFLAELTRRKPTFYHFNRRSGDFGQPDKFLRNICAQLITHYQLQIHNQLVGDDSKDFEVCLRAAIAKARGEPLLLIIDALDEVTWHSLNQNILYLPEHIPERVFIIVSMRPEKRIPLAINGAQQRVDLLPKSDGNQHDIQTYIREQVHKSREIETLLVQENIRIERFVDILCDKSDGNFMYLHHVLSDIRRGKRTNLNQNSLPRGLIGYYEQHWKRMEQEVGGSFTVTHKQVLAMLAALEDSASSAEIAFYIDELNAHQVSEILKDWQQYLLIEQERFGKTYQIYHYSFAEFLFAEVELPEFKRRIVEQLKKIPRRRSRASWKDLQ